jgi:hypothetical protein
VPKGENSDKRWRIARNTTTIRKPSRRDKLTEELVILYRRVVSSLPIVKAVREGVVATVRVRGSPSSNCVSLQLWDLIAKLNPRFVADTAYR